MNLKRKTFIVAFLIFALSGILLLVFNIGNNNGLRGAGTVVNPYRISNENDLQVLNQMIEEGDTLKNRYIIQTENISISEESSIFPLATGEGVFLGIYDGRGHSISNINIDNNNAALFENMGGMIKNLALMDGVIKGRNAASFAIDTKDNNGKIINCTSDVTIIGDYKAAGIASSFTNGSIIFSSYTGDIISDNSYQICGSDANEIIVTHMTSLRSMYPDDYSGYSYFVGGNDKYKEAILNSFLSIHNSTFQPNKRVEVIDGKIQYSSTLLHSKRIQGLEGRGTRQNPYIIRTPEDYLFFVDLVNVGIDFYHQYVIQVADLDFGKYTNVSPIGIFDSGHYFWGTYNGNGYIIKNLRMQRTDNCGLFGELAGTVINTNLIDSYIEGACIGSFVSHSFAPGHPQLINCYSNAILKGDVERTGGIADNFNGGDIIQCVVDTSKSDESCFSICSYNAENIYDSYDFNKEKNTNKFVNEEYFLGNINCAEVIDCNIGKTLNEKMSRYSKIRHMAIGEFCKWEDNADSNLRITNRKNHAANSIEQIIYYLIAIIFVGLMIFVMKKYMAINLCTNFNSTRKLYVYSIYGFAILFIFLNIIFDGLGFDKLFFYALRDTFSDRYFCVQLLSKLGGNRYSQSGFFYPPLMALIYWIPAVFNCGDIHRRFGYLGTDIENDSQQLMLFTVFTIVLMVIFWALIRTKVKGNKVEKDVIAFSFFFLAPVLFGIERGNSFIFSLVFLLIFVFNYRDNRKNRFECALIMLAVAINLKIYPIIFIALLINPKRIKESINNILRVILYSATIGIVSMLPFGGINAIINFVRTVTSVGSRINSNKEIFSDYGINYHNLCSLFLPTNIALIGNYLLLIMLTFTIVLAFIFDVKDYKKIILLCISICVLPTISYYYVTAVFIIPLIEIMNIKKANKYDYIYIALMLFMVALMPYYFIDIDIRLQGVTSAICMILMQIIILIEVIEHRIIRKNNI